MRTIDTSVLIVGAGPAGLTATALLARSGVQTITVTKYGGTANSPRAHITNQRSGEVFRDLGIEDRVAALATPHHLMGNNVWATSFTGQEIARLMTWGAGIERNADYQASSPSQMCNAPQHILEPVILEAARESGADIRFATELVAISQDEDGVLATVRERTTGSEYAIRAQYVIGADGGRSTVATRLGFTFDGESGLGAAVNVWLEADLTPYTAHRPGTLYWMCQPGNDYWVGSGTFICVKPWTEWVMLFMYDPADGEPDISEEAMLARARTTIGDPEVAVRIKAVSRWEINHLVAAEYRKGRAFLVGDAAHRHPPANGLGSNTSIQDSYNLAWKLAAVVHGQAGPELLDSYDAERRPVGKQVVDRAMKSVADMLPISQALGFRPGQSAEEGWASLAEVFADSDAAQQRRTALKQAVALQNYQFNSHGVEMGQRYDSGAVIDDGTPYPPFERDPELYYHPTTHPGAYLPHAWLQHGTQRLSTLDLAGRGSFSLITGVGGEPWLDAAKKMAAEYRIDLPAHSVGARCAYDDVYGDWADLREITDHGCLLIRPDRHIAWRSHDLPADPEQALREALDRILARPAAVRRPAN
ncbi:FAD-dependent monooxygenase [Streptomyces albipurpureus]|uniref:FAD-dependent monooxygenase n=1 Tax=Streptomyces albipurpureus TaxID=2897419 RepID=A0ABT0UNK6_9ACTN|nr:FAD-dependent monooxygenase [Streptomyces sp. CWNU-1]MCM2389675.1 FAD-dependent monooxygenase [Streptomyces sp. CWNU-1]